MGMWKWLLENWKWVVGTLVSLFGPTILAQVGKASTVRKMDRRNMKITDIESKILLIIWPQHIQISAEQVRRT